MTPEADEMVNDIKTTIHISMPLIHANAKALAVLQATQSHEEAWAELGAWTVQWLGLLGDLMIAKESVERRGVDSGLVKMVSTVLTLMGNMQEAHERLMDVADRVADEIVRNRDA
jgi:hypothetical protein